MCTDVDRFHEVHLNEHARPQAACTCCKLAFVATSRTYQQVAMKHVPQTWHRHAAFVRIEAQALSQHDVKRRIELAVDRKTVAALNNFHVDLGWLQLNPRN